MKELGTEIIEIAGNEYKLFLNRKGIVAWEKYAKEENAKARALQEKYKDLDNEEDLVIEDDTNPFDNTEDVSEEDTNIISTSYRKLYWIMLFENHKLSYKEANKLYDLAIKEYGEVQLIQLATQMIQDANSNQMGDINEIKKLPALKPSKK